MTGDLRADIVRLLAATPAPGRLSLTDLLVALGGKDNGLTLEDLTHAVRGLVLEGVVVDAPFEDRPGWAYQLKAHATPLFADGALGQRALPGDQP